MADLRDLQANISRQDIELASAGASLTTKFASIDTASSGDNTIVAAVGGKKLRIICLVVVASAAVSIRWKSGAATNKSGAMALDANGGYALSSDRGLLETDSGGALVLNLSAAVQVSGHVAYVEV